MLVRLISANDSYEYLQHRTYLPYVGFLLMLLSAFPDKWFEFKTKPNKFIISSLLVLFSIVSIFQQKKYMDAMAYWGSAIQYAPDRAWFHYYMGRYYFKQKDYGRFEKYLLTADSLKSYPEFKYHLGMVALLDKQDYEKAYLYIVEALKKGYTTDEARSNFIKLCIESSNDFFQKGSYVKAISRCEEAVINDPSNGVAAYNLGIYLVNNGEKQRAASMWKRAIHLNADLTQAYRSLFFYYHYDVKRADSAAWYAREYNKHGGTENLISSQ
jgi:tetratricopeptide (TPR) repeat protein